MMDPDLMDSGTFWAGRIRNFLSGSGFYCISAQFRKFFCSEVIEFDIDYLHTMLAWQWLLREVPDRHKFHVDDEKIIHSRFERLVPSNDILYYIIRFSIVSVCRFAS
jgi:hypothetical protein